jgi:hypothetical protein
MSRELRLIRHRPCLMTLAEFPARMVWGYFLEAVYRAERHMVPKL